MVTLRVMRVCYLPYTDVFLLQPKTFLFSSTSFFGKTRAQEASEHQHTLRTAYMHSKQAGFVPFHNNHCCLRRCLRVPSSSSWCLLHFRPRSRSWRC